MKKSCRQTTYRPSIQAFTLIELLVVIAIIALLAAIIFPAFFTAKEKARQTTAISNLKQISTAFARYRLDNNQKPPTVLFAYAYPGASMGSVKSMVPQTNHSDYLSGLYPQYINDPTVFMDPNNSVDDPSATVSAGPVYKVDPTTGLLTAVTMPAAPTFYKADAYDISPKITGPNAVDNTTMVVRYRPAWTNITGPFAAGVSSSDYSRQPFFPSPPGDTYIASTTYHVKNQNKVIVLFESGTVKTLDASVFDDNGGTFWKLHR